FKNNEIDLLEGDVLYFFSDGFQDQFGGPADKKFKVKKFKELILSIQDKSMDQQKEILNNTIESWRKYRLDEGIEVEQIDDILVMGVKV
ncbi:MAG: serine/threonine protein kinase, partial [Marinilabiliales bacterium]